MYVCMHVYMHTQMMHLFQLWRLMPDHAYVCMYVSIHAHTTDALIPTVEDDARPSPKQNQIYAVGVGKRMQFTIRARDRNVEDGIEISVSDRFLAYRCVCIYICIYMHAHVCKYMYTYTHVQDGIEISVSDRFLAYRCMCVCIYICACTCG